MTTTVTQIRVLQRRILPKNEKSTIAKVDRYLDSVMELLKNEPHQSFSTTAHNTYLISQDGEELYWDRKGQRVTANLLSTQTDK